MTRKIIIFTYCVHLAIGCQHHVRVSSFVHWLHLAPRVHVRIVREHAIVLCISTADHYLSVDHTTRVPKSEYQN